MRGPKVRQLFLERCLVCQSRFRRTSSSLTPAGAFLPSRTVSVFSRSVIVPRHPVEQRASTRPQLSRECREKRSPSSRIRHPCAHPVQSSMRSDRRSIGIALKIESSQLPRREAGILPIRLVGELFPFLTQLSVAIIISLGVSFRQVSTSVAQKIFLHLHQPKAGRLAQNAYRNFFERFKTSVKSIIRHRASAYFRGNFFCISPAGQAVI